MLDRPLLAIDMRLPDRLVFRPKTATNADTADMLVHTADSAVQRTAAAVGAGHR